VGAPIVRIALIGATGFVGSALLKEALERGHEVTAIVRHPDSSSHGSGSSRSAST
jgi:putative NADH-flavin reductase